VKRSIAIIAGLFSLGLIFHSAYAAEPFYLHDFERIELTDVYYSEGAAFGDINHDGIADVVYGPYWFAGPDYKTKQEIYPALAQPRQGYADNFFSWIYDFNGDGWNDVLVVGFPGTPAYVYENPKEAGFSKAWPKHEILDWVSNESPQFTNVVGDDKPELVCTRDGYFGYATINRDDPLGKWEFHAVSKQIASPRFGHGLGVGDVNGDGRQDILQQNGWLAQPASLAGDPEWTLHPVTFSKAGGADMYAYDVDGDGDNDVITSLEAHSYGLAWHEQIRQGGKILFRQHLIMGNKPEDNAYGVLFTEPHAVQLVDMDGDGLKDIVTGKTYWSHHTQSPMWDAGAVAYWFKLVRGPNGVDWVPHKANGDSGVGRGLAVGDVNGDKLPDIVTGGMKGANVLIHRRKSVDEATWQAAQPRRHVAIKAGLAPKDAARQMTVPSGFQVQLAAGEPLVHQPVGFTIDHRGRIWVAEAYTYPRRALEGQGKDKIIILEDTNGDGSLDSRKVFSEGLNLVSGLEVGFGGVWVGAAPYLMFIPDADGDDRPDGEPVILLDGFGYQDTHETLNAFIWGPDGWLYGCHGVFTHSLVGKPGTAAKDRTPLNAAVWRYHPTRHEFDIFSHGTSNAWGVDFNDHGQSFVTACVIPHLWHIVQGARYQRQGGRHFNPHIYDDIKTIADHRHYVGDIRDHAWWGQEPNAPTDTLGAGGGHAHCGAMVYLGDNWPDRYRNQIFMNNIHGNRVNNDILEREGSGFVGHHGDDLLLANDRWFRGINLKYGPDGSVYLIDWYDRNACHRSNPEIWDRTNGRVYNVSYGKPARVNVDLERLDDAALVRLQLHKNDWYVRTARRILQHRAATGRLSDGVHRDLWDIVKDNPDVTRKLRAIWVLHVTAGLDEEAIVTLLDHPNEYVRSWAIQLDMEDSSASPSVLNRIAEMAALDSSPVVRLYVASALQRLPLQQRWPIAEALAAHSEDADDHNLPLMYWYGIEPLVASNPSRAMAMASSIRIPTLRRFIIRRAASDAGLRNVGFAPPDLANGQRNGAASDSKMLDTVVGLISSNAPSTTQLLVLDEMLRAFEGRVNIAMPKSWTPAYDRLVKSDDPTVRERADQVAMILGDKRVLPRLRERLLDANAQIPKRLEALEILVRGQDRSAVTAMQAVLNTAELRGPALRALALYNDPGTPAAVLGVYAKLNESQRRDAINTLVTRPEYALVLLDAMKDDVVPRTDLHAYNVRQLLGFNNDQLNDRIRQIWGDFRATSSDRLAQIAAFKTAFTAEALKAADTSNGRRIFAKTCATCHILFGEGEKVGPDITGANRGNLDYILENIVDPSAVVAKDYLMTLIAMDDGRLVSGLVQKETDSALTVRTINDTVVLAKDEIEETKLSNLSIMPERLLDTLGANEVRDLIAYLGSPAQVALRGPKSPIDASTGKVPGAIEGESMKLIGKTGGTVAGQSMASFSADAWSGNDHLWWTGGKPGARIDLELPVAKAGRYDLEIVLTKARDYAVVQLTLDGEKLGGPLDLFNTPEVITTGVLSFATKDLKAGTHRLGVQLVGANPKAVKAYMVGIDFVRLKSTD